MSRFKTMVLFCYHVGMVITAREAAFFALDAYFQRGIFIADALDGYQVQDFAFAYELACGVVRQKKALVALAKRYVALPEKRAGKILLYMSLYQLVCMDKVPAFAVGDEMVKLAKKYTSNHFAKFLNAFLRNQAPKCTADDLIPSYTDYFIERMVASYGQQLASEIMTLGNQHGALFARDRTDMSMIPIDRVDLYTQSNRYYIQNPTQVAIYQELKNGSNIAPETILDLCACPGGKTILVHDMYPNARLFANDISEKKVELLRKNLDKYEIKATLSVGPGQEYKSDQLFDLIVLDAPCSNSGCLYKCPEARWRLTKDEIAKHVDLQKRLFQHACTLLSPKGVIWYSTCSILPEENESILRQQVRIQKLILPNREGYEGGFGAAYFA